MWKVKPGMVAGLGLSAGLLSAGAACGQGQGLGNAPYAQVGLGEAAANLGGVRQLGMGGTGVAAPNTGNVNELNPALLVYTPRTTWEAAITGQVKTVSNATSSYRTNAATLGYLALVVPLSTRWGAALGLKPYSTVDYGSAQTITIANDPNQAVAFNRFSGNGGISEAYLAQGFHLLRDLNLGFSASYLFGTVDQNSSTTISTPTSVQQTVVENESLRYSDFLFRAAAQYRHKFSDKLNLNLGAVHTFQKNINVLRQRNLQRLDLNGAVSGPPTLLQDDQGRTLVPALTQVGLTLDNGRSWTVSLDAAQQPWSRFQSFNQQNVSNLSDTWRLALGGELTPDPGSIDHFRQRVTYRLGLSVAQLPFVPNGQRLYDRAVHWGFSLPLPATNPLESTNINLGFVLGMRGNTSFVSGDAGESNVRETYLRVQVGASLSNRWFIKRRLM